MTDNTQELLPCPFCGSKAKEARSLHKRDSARVVCTNGDCLVSIEADELWQDFSHAAAKWNTRAQPAPAAGDVVCSHGVEHHNITQTECKLCGAAIAALPAPSVGEDEAKLALDQFKTIRSCIEAYSSERVARGLQNGLDRVEGVLRIAAGVIRGV